MKTKRNIRTMVATAALAMLVAGAAVAGEEFPSQMTAAVPSTNEEFARRTGAPAETTAAPTDVGGEFSLLADIPVETMANSEMEEVIGQWWVMSAYLVWRGGW